MAARRRRIPVEIDTELTPKAREFVRQLIEDYERIIADLKAQLAEQRESQPQTPTPENSSASQHATSPHAAWKTKAQVGEAEKKAWRPAGASSHDAAAGPQRTV